MDLPTNKGIVLDFPQDKESPLVTSRRVALERLNRWGKKSGVLSRDSVKFIIGENGKVRCIAKHFIPANKDILHVPFKMDLSFNSLKTELVADKNWTGWTELKTKIKQFEEDFQWNPYNYDQKDYFSKNVQLAVCIIGILHKLDTIASRNDHEKQHVEKKEEEEEVVVRGEDGISFILETFSFYWKALPYDIGNILYNWTPLELACLHGSSFANCLSDAKRYGEELFFQVIYPFTQEHTSIFGTKLTVEHYFYINSIILTQSFSTGQKEKSALLPIIDMIAGKPNEMHNCTLENCAIKKEVKGEFIKFHALESFCDIHAGEEIFIEYAQVGNSDYLMTYNYIPLDPEVIMNNQKTNIHLDLAEFLECELLRMHPNTPKVRTMKRHHIYGFFNLPKTIPISMEDLFSNEYSCIPSIRQVLIFLQFDESDAHKAIKTSRIKSQLNPSQLHFLFHLFLKFIESSFNKVSLPLFRALLSNKLPQSMVELVHDYGNNEQLYYALNDLVTASLTPASLLTVSLQSIQMIEKGMALPPAIMLASSNSNTTSGGSGSGTRSRSGTQESVGGREEGEREREEMMHSTPVKDTTATASGTTTTTGNKKKAAANKTNPNANAKTSPGTDTEEPPQATAAGSKSHSSKKESSASAAMLFSEITLTPNMRSAIYLQMSERLIIEVMINRFIHLFPESFHELGYSLLRDHLVSSEISSILEELCRPFLMNKSLHCLVCGSTQNVSKCSRCRKALYCSSSCQKEHWQYHRLVCKPAGSAPSTAAVSAATPATGTGTGTAAAIASAPTPGVSSTPMTTAFAVGKDGQTIGLGAIPLNTSLPIPLPMNLASLAGANAGNVKVEILAAGVINGGKLGGHHGSGKGKGKEK